MMKNHLSTFFVRISCLFAALAISCAPITTAAGKPMHSHLINTAWSEGRKEASMNASNHRRFLSASPRYLQGFQVSSMTQTGVASYYGREFTGRRTASGPQFDPNSNMAAHRTLRFGTIVLVTNLDNGRSTKVKIVDRGPFAAGRIVDLPPKKAHELGVGNKGLMRVSLKVVQPPNLPR